MADVVYRSPQHLPQRPARDRHLPALARRTAAPPAAAPPRADPDVMLRGERVYADHCADCHGEGGAGHPPAYPALAGNASATGSVAANAIKAVLFGGYAPATDAHPRPYGMPPYFHVLKDADVAAVVTYVRASWGNAGTPVSTVDVERYRDVR